jgi:hypothetical protein
MQTVSDCPEKAQAVACSRCLHMKENLGVDWRPQFFLPLNTRKTRKIFNGCGVEVRDRLGKFHARTINHMWSLPSLTSLSEGIWSAGVPGGSP